MYGTWDIKPNRQIFFGHFGPFFALLPPLKTWKIKIFKKWKKDLEILSFYKSVPKIMIICFTVPEIWHVTDVIVVFHVGLFFVLLPPISPKNENFKEMKKVPRDIIISHKCAKNHDHIVYCSWSMHSVHPPFWWGLNLLPNFQKGGRGGEGGLDRTTLRGDCWKRGGKFFQEGCNFSKTIN